MALFRVGWDPGPCPVDDVEHTACVAPPSTATPLETVMLPQRDALLTAQREAAARVRTAAEVVTTPPPGVPPLKPGEFTTATYRRGHLRKDAK